MGDVTMARALTGKIAVVTGASRGIGKGIAVALGRAGATVYVTGRTLAPGIAPWPGTIAETAEQVTRGGGHGIAVRCDHRNDAEVEALFDQVQQEQGRLDLLVNGATGFAASASGYPPEDVPCWQLPIGCGTSCMRSGCARTMWPACWPRRCCWPGAAG